MKKIIAVILCAVLMLSVSAFTGGPAAGQSYTLSGITVNTAGQAIDMSAVTIGVDVLSGDPGALLLHVDYEGETVSEIGFTEADGLYIIHLASPTLGHKDYAIDPVKELAKSLGDLRDKLVEKLQSVDTAEAAQRIMDFFDAMAEAADKAPAEPVATPEPAETFSLPEINVGDGFEDTLKECITQDEIVTLEGETVSFNGVETPIPDGEYKASAFTVDKEHFLRALGMITVNGEPVDALGVLSDESLDIELEGAFHTGQGDVGVSFGHMGCAAAQGENSGVIALGYLQTTTETGKAVQFTASKADGEDVTAVTFTVSKDAVGDDAFGPDSVDMDALINLSDMSEEEGNALLQQDLGMVFGEALGAVTAPIYAAIPAEAE